MINKTRTKIWIVYTASLLIQKDMCPLRQITREVALRNIPFCLARLICAIAEEEETKLKRLSELKASLKKRKHPIALIESSIERALQVPLNE